MLKILKTIPYFIPAYGIGGGALVHALNVSKVQASLGYDITVLTSNILTNEIISKDLPKYEVLDGIKIHRFPIRYRLGKSHYFITPKFPIGFLKYNYNIIHSHTFRTFQTEIAMTFSKLKKKPFVLTAHGTLRNISLFKWCDNKEKESRRINLYDFFFKNMFLNVVDRVIVNSKYEKFWTLKNNVPEKIIRIIPHGVNLKVFSNMSYREKFIKKFNVNGKMILYVGKLLRGYRNISHLIKVMNEIIKEIKNAKLWIIGHILEKDYEIELKKLVKKLNLTKHVIFITLPTREDVIGAYQCANVVTFPITDSDSFGIPLLEAGAVKCPIISTKIGPAPEIIKDGKTGILTEINDLNQLKESILKILTDDELQKKMGAKAYETVLKKYTWEIVAKKVNEVYSELI